MGNTFLITALVSAGLPAAAATVVLTPTTLTPAAGSVFQLGVSITGNADEIIGFGFDVRSSDALRASFQSAVFAAPFANTPVPGTSVSGTAFPGATAPSVSLATLSFLAGPQPGVVDIGISSNLTSPNEGLFFLFADTSNLTSSVRLNITGTAAVAEPSTLSLISGAVIGFAACRPRRRLTGVRTEETPKV